MTAEAPAPDRRSRCEAADQRPSDVDAQIRAAYACDREGLEAVAVVYYDRASALGVTGDERAEFLVGYGSTLRNVGRLEDSRRVLEQAREQPTVADAARAFLALTLLADGKPGHAVGALVDLLLDLDQSGRRGAGIERYRRALAFYADDLRRSRNPGPVNEG